MEPARLLPITIVLAGCLSIAAAGQPDTPQRPASPAAPAPAPAAGDRRQDPAAQKPPAELARCVSAIKAAADPVAAISAYARGYGIDPKSLALHQAFLDRMLQAELPGLAHESARVVVAAEPNHGRAWAVVAHMHARSGELEKALAAVVQAGKLLPTDPFVLRTAGEMLARYDHEKDLLKMPDSLQAALEKLRNRLQTQPEFARAYEAAKGELAKRPPPAGEGPRGLKAPDTKPVPGRALEDSSREAERRLRALESEIRSLEEAIRQGRLGRSYADPGGAYFYYYSGPAYAYPYLPYGYVPYGWRDWGGTGLRVGGRFSYYGGRLSGRLRIGTGRSRLGGRSSYHRMHNLHGGRSARFHTGRGVRTRPPGRLHVRP